MTKNNLNDIYKITNILQHSKLSPVVQEHFMIKDSNYCTAINNIGNPFTRKFIHLKGDVWRISIVSSNIPRIHLGH